MGKTNSMWLDKVEALTARIGAETIDDTTAEEELRALGFGQGDAEHPIDFIYNIRKAVQDEHNRTPPVEARSEQDKPSQDQSE